MSDRLFERYSELQRYVGWTDEDARRVAAVGPLLEPFLASLIDDFYDTIERHPDARKVITGGAEQIARLKGTLRDWVRELLSGRYDAAYVARRWRVGWRHVEIGLDQVYTNVALSRLRTGLMQTLRDVWTGNLDERFATIRALNRLLDLDLAIIEDAYQAEHLLRQQKIERLAAIGQVAGGVAHELRNPLNVINTSVYYLTNARRASLEKQAEHLERIAKQVRLANQVITTLSDFAKLPMPDRRPVPVEPLLRAVLDAIGLPAAIHIEMDCPPDLPPALADAAQLDIALSNLVRNAHDAMPDGGRLRLSARPVDHHLAIAVADTGHGIAAENLSRIMEPFFSTKARGIGLGLALTRAILERNSGSIQVQSEPGQGTTFTVRLEAAPGAEQDNSGGC